ncbi:S8 family serine peptidase [Corynebacterium sp. CCM 9186]|uniref:S8 family peptidase n=1 Tax=Corynebacterium meridianum TaxID=2765363 RepID=UPI002003C493|nr:S8 family peptidase [Corynebacterium meridianum]MCK7678045.1 S8 family serine peptidase [Corynebacterium meridianum]
MPFSPGVRTVGPRPNADTTTSRQPARRRSLVAALTLSTVVASGILAVTSPAVAQDANADHDPTVINNPDDNTRLDPHDDTAPDADGMDRFIVAYRDGEHPDLDELVTDNGRAGVFGRAAGDAGTRTTEVSETATGALVVATDRKLNADEAENFMESLRKNDKVDYVEPDARMTIFSTPNDRYYDKQWPIHGPNGARVDTAWTTTPDAGGTVVAVVDSGILPHPDLDARVLDGYDFISDPWSSRDGDGRDSNPQDNGDWFLPGECNNPEGANSSWHGTHVAGTIGAATNNGIGVAATAPGSRILPVRALGKCGGLTSDIADAIIWSAGGRVNGAPENTNPASVINLSLGGQGRCSRTYQRAIDFAVERGATVVVAAGNDAIDASRVQPANCDNVITVGASGESGAPASYSNYGHVLDITAPGGDMNNGAGVLSTLNTGTRTPGSPAYAYYEGTSMATPLVSGVAALLHHAEPGLTPDQIKTRITDTARPLSRNCWAGCGSGLIDAAAAVGAGEHRQPRLPRSIEPGETPIDDRGDEGTTPVETEPVTTPAPVEPEPVSAPVEDVRDDSGSEPREDDTRPAPAPGRRMGYLDWLRTLYWLSYYGLGHFWR